MKSEVRGTTSAAALVCAVALLSGCGDGGDDGDLPPLEPSPSADANAEAAVTESVAKYNEAVESMQGEAPLDLDKLRSVATPELTQKVGESIQVAEAEGLTVRHPPGGVKHSDATVTVEGAEATLVECVDRRGTVLVLKGKAQPPDDSVFAPIRTTYTVKQVDGGWRVAATEDGAKC